MILYELAFIVILMASLAIVVIALALIYKAVKFIVSVDDTVVPGNRK